MRKLKLHKKEIIRGAWKFESKNLGYLSLKKGDTKIPLEESLFLDGDGNFYNCVKIGDLIYDVISYEDGIATLEEEIKEDFDGNLLYEESIPLIIKKEMDVTKILANEEKNFKKLNYIEKTLDMLGAKKKAYWISKLTEAGQMNIVASQTVITTIDEEAFIKQDAEQDQIRKYLALVVYFDLDYQYEDGSTMWEALGVKKGNYFDVVNKFIELGIFGNESDYLDLKFTIDAIRAKEVNIKGYVEAKMAEVEWYKALQEVKKSMSEEDFKIFLENMRNQNAE